MNLRIPGPTPLPPQVLAAMSKPIINHRGPTFAEMQKKIGACLQEILATRNEILIFPSSGTGGMESALVNVLSPGDRVLALSAGFFGDRFADLARAFGAQVEKLSFPLGSAIDPDKVAEKLRALGEVRAVIFQHNETSTGLMHPVQQVARAVRENSGALIVVDAVSSAAATPLLMDAWEIDVVITGSQKALMCPPGASILAISERAWKASENARTPRYYWDWKEWKKWAAKGQTPFTPALPVYFALDAAVDMINDEGLSSIYARHERIAEMVRSRAADLGCELFPDPRYASCTVTALRPPSGVDAVKLIARARDELGVEFAGGQGELAGKIFRIGHLGYVHTPEMEQALSALKQVIEQRAPVQAAG